ncbi:helix-turn-helix domain-containing protein [Sphingomonas sp. VNH70]|uniref:TetR/AcrR family transcriptional regulator n=1 Tax=Sphingomonas silueang TaxID=3156617 RepID=UPI0032B36319
MTTADTLPAERTLRSDAAARREALIEAAAACFREEGYRVPFEAVAARAGVGRGTLYRNFRDREALALAIFSREIERMAASLDPAQPFEATFERILREGAPTLTLFGRISSELLADGDNRAAFMALGARMEAALAPVVAAAHARGELAVGVSAHDVALSFRMVGGLLRSFFTEDEVGELIGAALRLILDGLRPR